MSSQTYVDSVTLSSAAEWNKWDTAAYAALSGVAGTNTITATGPANLTLVATNPPLWFIPAATNTGATNINITPSGGAALGAKNIFSGGKACSGGEIVINVPCAIVYDGTQYNIIGSGVPTIATVAAHATTANPWVAREVTLTGGAVTFTDIADAPAAGATVWVYQNAAHTWTHGATLAVQGEIDYLAYPGDWVRIYAVTVSTFTVTIFRVRNNTQGAFTASLTGCTAGVTGAASYSVNNNVATVYYPPLTGTSNTTAATLTGQPAAIQPTTAHLGLVGITQDNTGTPALARVDVGTDGVVTLYVSSSSSTFTGSGTKGINAGLTITYNLN